MILKDGLAGLFLFSVPFPALFALSIKARKQKKAEPLLALPSSNRNQVLGGGCNWGIADMRIYHNFWEGFKSADMLE